MNKGISPQKVIATKRGVRKADGTAPEITPSLTEMVKSGSSAALQHVLRGMPKADKETVKERMSVCDSCDRLGQDGKWKDRCLVCGCFMKVKAKWADQKCPLNKW